MSDEAQTQIRPAFGAFCPRCGGPLRDGHCANPLCTPPQSAPTSGASHGQRPPFLMIAMVGLGALSLVVIGIVAVNVLRSGPSGSEAAAAGQAASGGRTPASGSGTSAGATVTRTPTSIPTPTATGPRKIQMGPQARICAMGTGPFSEVWAGVDATTCPFSENVAAAYRASGPSTTQLRKLRVHSPVTNLDYDVTCEPTVPVRCMTNTGATVYVVP